MSGGWQYVASQTSIEFLHRCKPAERQRVIRILEALTSDPYIRPDATSNDKTGRPIALIWRESFEIVYWLDHFVNDVRAIEILRR